EFAERIGGGYGPDDLLLQMARTIGEGVGATEAHVWLRVGTQLQVAGSWPDRSGSSPTVRLDRGEVPAIRGADGVYPVRQEGELLGALSVTKPRGDRLTQTEDKLVADLAAQAG